MGVWFHPTVTCRGCSQELPFFRPSPCPGPRRRGKRKTSTPLPSPLPSASALRGLLATLRELSSDQGYLRASFRRRRALHLPSGQSKGPLLPSSAAGRGLLRVLGRFLLHLVWNPSLAWFFVMFMLDDFCDATSERSNPDLPDPTRTLCCEILC